ncbi:WYL domain-containing protein [Paenibacillus sp.]|uniref:WYL domain-containing protein n=1 Tax=Paenibacillus sp. TaxID=58172 RepID=UPI0035CCE87C
MEYLHGRIEKEYENGDCVLHFHVPEEEHLWFGTLLALGNKVRVLEPDDLKERLCAAAKEIWKMYSIYDT